MVGIVTSGDCANLSTEARISLALETSNSFYRRMNVALRLLPVEEQAQINSLAAASFEELKGTSWLSEREEAELKWETTAEASVWWAETRRSLLPVPSSIDVYLEGYHQTLSELIGTANAYLAHRAEYLELGGREGLRAG